MTGSWENFSGKGKFKNSNKFYLNLLCKNDAICVIKINSLCLFYFNTGNIYLEKTLY